MVGSNNLSFDSKNIAYVFMVISIPAWPKDRLTRFEVARIIGARALQISLGAPILIKVKKGEFDPIKIAEEEFKAGQVPMTIKRPLPNGEFMFVDIKAGIKNWLKDHNGEVF